MDFDARSTYGGVGVAKGTRKGGRGQGWAEPEGPTTRLSRAERFSRTWAFQWKQGELG